MTEIHRQREEKKKAIFLVISKCALLTSYLYKLEKVLHLHASISGILSVVVLC